MHFLEYRRSSVNNICQLQTNRNSMVLSFAAVFESNEFRSQNLPEFITCKTCIIFLRSYQRILIHPLRGTARGKDKKVIQRDK